MNVEKTMFNVVFVTPTGLSTDDAEQEYRENGMEASWIRCPRSKNVINYDYGIKFIFT